MRAIPFFLFFVACGTPEGEVTVDATSDKAKEVVAAADGHDADGHDHEGHAHGEMKKTEAVVKDGWAHYGEAFTLTEAKECGAVIDGAAELEGKTVRVTGTIENVCQKKGCWMVLADADGDFLRVAMKDHAFGVPVDTKTGEGTLADIEGVLIKKELDAATLEHLKGEAKGTPEELEKQFAPKYELVAASVALKQG